MDLPELAPNDCIDELSFYKSKMKESQCMLKKMTQSTYQSTPDILNHSRNMDFYQNMVNIHNEPPFAAWIPNKYIRILDWITLALMLLLLVVSIVFDNNVSRWITIILIIRTSVDLLTYR